MMRLKLILILMILLMFGQTDQAQAQRRVRSYTANTTRRDTTFVRKTFDFLQKVGNESDRVVKRTVGPVTGKLAREFERNARSNTFQGRRAARSHRNEQTKSQKSSKKRRR